MVLTNRDLNSATQDGLGVASAPRTCARLLGRSASQRATDGARCTFASGTATLSDTAPRLRRALITTVATATGVGRLDWTMRGVRTASPNRHCCE